MQDGTRNELIAKDREKYSNEIKSILASHDMEYISLSGDYHDRFVTAKRMINEKFGIQEVWRIILERKKANGNFKKRTKRPNRP